MNVEEQVIGQASGALHDMIISHWRDVQATISTHVDAQIDLHLWFPIDAQIAPVHSPLVTLLRAF